MMSCKGKPTPDTVLFVTTYVSAVYIPVGTIGNLLLILAIIIDPLKKLRKRFHMWLINIAVAAIIICAAVNPYRVYGNYLRGSGQNIDKVIGPTRPTLSRICHVNLFSSQLVVLSIFAIRMLEQVFDVQVRPKISMIVFGVGTFMVWGVCLSCGSLTVIYGFDVVEWPIYSVTCIGALIGFIISSCFLYRPLKKASKDAEETLPVRSESTLAQHAGDSSSGIEESNGAKDDDTNPSKIARLPIGDNDEDGGIDVKMKNAKALLSAFLFLFLCSANSFVMVYLTALEAVPSCVEYFWLKHFRILFVVSISAFTPYVLIFTVPNMKRSVVALVKIKRSPTVAPASD